LTLDFDDYRNVLSAGAIIGASSIEALAQIAKLPADALAATVAEVATFVASMSTGPIRRDFTGKPPLAKHWYAAKVTGALFHTQGGLIVDNDARVLDIAGNPLPNLFAGGGAPRGISGAAADGLWRQWAADCYGIRQTCGTRSG
jgi:fumarate reductase flavoprotein subunit